jgi:hypothetical protein
MAISACAHCQNQSFELQEAKVSGARHRVMFVQCTHCGTPAGLVESHAATLLQEQDLRIKGLQKQVSTLEASVAHIRHLVGALANQRAI